MVSNYQYFASLGSSASFLSFILSCNILNQILEIMSFTYKYKYMSLYKMKIFLHKDNTIITSNKISNYYLISGL